jgi:hypothetical protein
MLITEVYPKILSDLGLLLTVENFDIYQKLEDGMGVSVFSNHDTLTVAVRCSMYPFLLFTLKRREFEYNLDDFRNTDEIMGLIKSFFSGKYTFSTDVEDTLASVQWSNEALHRFDRKFSNYSQLEYTGIVWKP